MRRIIRRFLQNSKMITGVLVQMMAAFLFGFTAVEDVYKRQVYNVIKAPKLSTIKGKYPTPYADVMRYTATWNKVSGAMGYQCQLKTYCWSGWNTMYEKKSKSNRSVSIEGSDIEKIKIKVRAYKKVNGISVYGSWSNTRSKKCW